MKRLVGGVGAALGAKLVTGLAVAALAAAGATAAAESAITGSLNPNDWGQQVVQQVAKCKAALQPGQHGIGQCVSAFAKQHGDTVSDSHQASPGRTNPGKGHDKNDKGHGGGNSGTNGQPGSKEHGKPISDGAS
jgi:hypothetical protein